MKLYHFPPSPNSRRVLAVAYHLGFDPELEIVDLPNGKQIHPNFIALNPNHKIPTLIDDDGFVLWESIAIMKYLTSKKPDSQLQSTDIKTQALIDQWLLWNTAHWSTACGVYVFEYLVKDSMKLGNADPEEIKKGEDLFHRFAGVLDEQLKDKEWLVDNKLTIADYAVASFLDLREIAHMPYQNYVEIQRWYDAIEALDEWKRSAPSNFM